MALRRIYYDTETTGLDPSKDFVIEIAAYDPVEDKSFVSFVNAGVSIPPEASKIHGITEDMIMDSPDIFAVVKDFVEFCGRDPVVLIAHNSDNFDIAFIKKEFSRVGVEIPCGWQFFDSLKWARRYRPDLSKHSLQFLRETYGISANNAHRAFDDVVILNKVCDFMLGDLSIERAIGLLYSGGGSSDEGSSRVVKMPFGKHKGKLLTDLPGGYITWMESSGLLDKNEQLKSSLKALKLI